MRPKDKIGELARIIDDRSYDPPKMTGSSLSISTDLETRINTLPTPIGDEGDVLTVIDDGGDLVPSWEPAGGAAAGQYRSPVYTTYGGGAYLFDSDGEAIYVLADLE